MNYLSRMTEINLRLFLRPQLAVRRGTFVASEDLVRALNENVRGDALQKWKPAPWALERARRCGVVSLFPGT
jgi:hypothetical protein